MRFADHWRPPIMATQSMKPEVGQIIALDYRAWEITHLGKMTEPDKHGRDTRATLRRIHGPKHEHENEFHDAVVRFGSWDRVEVYRSDRVWLCSCCGHPAPCRTTLAEEESQRAAREFDERLNRMGPGICYACGEVITSRQERITFPGEHADFPGRGAPTFHTRGKCYAERAAYARRAGLDPDGLPLLPFCEGTLTRHLDGSESCDRAGCPGTRAQHRCTCTERAEVR